MFTRSFASRLKVGQNSLPAFRQSIMSNTTSAAPAPTIIGSDAAGPIEATMIQKITARLHPTFLKVANDSHKHSHHAGMRGASNVKESHFRLEIISDEFSGLNMPSRHRLIYNLLDDELKNHGVHALQMKTKTNAEVNK